jgi:hypothetical protein
MSTSNSVEGLTFVDAKPVSFPPLQRRWASDWGRSAAYKSAAIHDLDGSVSGIPGAYIVIDNGIASHEEACEMKPSWKSRSPSRPRRSRQADRSAGTGGPFLDTEESPGWRMARARAPTSACACS